jgi:hypothetical protein
MGLRLENPKTFLPLMLFFGFVLVLVGTGWQSFTTNSGMVNAGWTVVAVAILLWIFAKLLDSQDY